MKLLPALLFIVTIVAASSCRKGKSNLYPPKLQYVLLSDVSNGHKLTGTKINLLSCLTDIGPGGICVEGPVIGMPITDTDGMIKFTDSRVTGFDCAVPGFFPLHRFITGQIDYDGLTYDVKLLPEAFLDIQLSPQTTYPAGYKFYMEWTCGAPLNFINTDGILQPDDNNPVESILTETIGGDIQNEIRWKLENDNYEVVARDTIRNIVVPRSDTGHLRIIF